MGNTYLDGAKSSSGGVGKSTMGHTAHTNNSHQVSRLQIIVKASPNIPTRRPTVEDSNNPPTGTGAVPSEMNLPGRAWIDPTPALASPTNESVSDHVHGMGDMTRPADHLVITSGHTTVPSAVSNQSAGVELSGLPPRARSPTSPPLAAGSRIPQWHSGQ